jgi:glutamine cyclotransferase
MMKLLLLPAIAVLFVSCNKPAPAALQYRVTATRPHDPDCYTQGLEFSGGRLFESGGQYGQSTVREVDPASGAVLRKRPMAKNVFAEGLTVLNGELWVLTWKEKTAYVLDPDTFKFIRTHNFEGEGWGLTNDGKLLIMSDGSSTLKFIDPKDFSVKRQIEVRDGGQPVPRLNELEFVNGEIFANIYTTDKIARISAADGSVSGWLDLSGLRRQLPASVRAEVLNGIAREPSSGRFLITGKYWPRMFEIEVSGQ